MLLLVVKYHNKTQQQSNFALVLYLAKQTESSSAQGASIFWEGVEIGWAGRNSETTTRNSAWKSTCRVWAAQPQCRAAFTEGWSNAAAGASGTTSRHWAPRSAPLKPQSYGNPAYFPQSKLHCDDWSKKRDAHLHFRKCILHSERPTQNYHWISLFRKRLTKRPFANLTLGARPNKYCPLLISSHVTFPTPILFLVTV